MEDKKGDKKKVKPVSKASPVGFIIVILIIAGVLSKTSWGKKLLLPQIPPEATSTTP